MLILEQALLHLGGKEVSFDFMQAKCQKFNSHDARGQSTYKTSKTFPLISLPLVLYKS